MTECAQSCFPFTAHFSREVVARFDGGQITAEAGALLLRPVEQRTGILRQFAACFHDYRRSDLVEHSVSELVKQRVYGIALGYEDLNDHDQLQQDPLLALLAGKRDVEGQDRRRVQDRGKAGAGKSTLNRLEVTPAGARADARYNKIVMDEAAVDRLLVDLYIQAQPREPRPLFWIWTRRMIRFTASRKGGSSTGITAATAICCLEEVPSNVAAFLWRNWRPGRTRGRRRIG